MSENIGSKIINQMLEELFGMKSKLGDHLEDGVIFTATLSNLKKFDGWDIRISIGPPGAFDDKDENEGD